MSPQDRRVYAIARDITDHKKAEIQLAEMSKEARHRAAQGSGLRRPVGRVALRRAAVDGASRE